MTDFSFLKSLQNSSKRTSVAEEAKKHINYQEYTVLVEGNEIDILIPLRECEEFEKTLSAHDVLEKKDLKSILRQHRGLRA